MELTSQINCGLMTHVNKIVEIYFLLFREFNSNMQIWVERVFKMEELHSFEFSNHRDAMSKKEDG